MNFCDASDSSNGENLCKEEAKVDRSRQKERKLKSAAKFFSSVYATLVTEDPFFEDFFAGSRGEKEV